VPGPPIPPIGLALTAAARVVGRAFDEALEHAGGSLPAWLILLNLTIGRTGNQRELAAAVGVREATLTYHLNAMERDGLLTRRRDPDNRRIHVVELTDAGRDLFASLREVAVAFDSRLRDGLSAAEAREFLVVLDRLTANAGARPDDTALWRGLVESPDARSIGRDIP
jgi:MarR family transcriptional regulator for hemolysin